MRLDIINPTAGPVSSAPPQENNRRTSLTSLQEHCRTMILHSVGLKNLARITELPLPKAIVTSLANQLTLEDLYVNRNDLNNEHMSHCVYPAKCLLDMSDVVIKVVPEVLANDEFNVVVDVWTKMKHPNLMSYYITFEKEGNRVLIFEYPPFAFPDVVKALKNDNKKIPEFLIWKAFHELAAVIKHIHDEGVIYPSLKPERLAFTEEGVLKLESGLLYAPTQNELMGMDAAGIDDSGVTGVYTSPETLKGEEVTIKNQVWILGCLLHEMAALEPAYANVGTDMFGAMGSIMEGKKPSPLEGYSEDLNTTISECLNTEPQTRPTIEDLQARSNAKMEVLVEGYKGENITHL
ncbi:hypothetical protein QZH41_002400 [Actinostola sp. cb2023]|nr:hypothetical protein QZH41_002400 [Actinostola sp. cb2023]